MSHNVEKKGNNLSDKQPEETWINFSKVIKDIENILVLVLQREIKEIDKDIKILVDNVSSFKRNASDLVQEIKEDLSNNTEGSAQMMDAVELFKKTYDLEGKLVVLSELGEMESLRLQMAMDRLSKLMSTLSNLLKKASETTQGITQNLK